MSVTVRVPGYATDVNRQVQLVAPSIGTVVLPWWPDEVARSALAGQYEEQPRPGRTPLLLRSGDPLSEIRIGCIVSTTQADRPGSVRELLDGLRKMALAKEPVVLKLASRAGRYRITDLGITELDWDSDGNASSAEVSLTLLAASDATVPVGPIKGKGSR